MELDTFVKETLVQIQQGIKEANIKIAETEGTSVRTNGDMQYMINKQRNLEKDAGILFDIAVTVTSEKSTGGEGKLSVVGISLGGGKNTTATEQSISRIKFRVETFNSIY